MRTRSLCTPRCVRGAANLLVGACLLMAASTSAQAQQYTLSLSGTPTFVGSANANFNVTADIKGTYVQATNPAGTRSILGNFNIFFPPPPPAAPRNDTVSLTGSATGTSSPSTRPTGSQVLRFNSFSRTVELMNLNIDVIGTSADPVLTLNSSITYPSFRIVVSPTSTYNYPWLGVALPIPLGNGALTDLRVVQDGRAVATGTPRTGGGVDFVMQVPVRFVGTALVNGSVAPVDVPQTISATGFLVPGTGASATASLTFASNVTQTLAAVPGDPLNPAPFQVPPPPTQSGPNADVLAVIGITGGTVALSGNAVLPSSGNQTNPADVAGPGQTRGPDGTRSADDIIVFINAFFAADPFADVASQGQVAVPDGQYTADDIIVFVGAFFAP
jgi:hypothetical protein